MFAASAARPRAAVGVGGERPPGRPRRGPARDAALRGFPRRGDRLARRGGRAQAAVQQPVQRPLHGRGVLRVHRRRPRRVLLPLVRARHAPCPKDSHRRHRAGPVLETPGHNTPTQCALICKPAAAAAAPAGRVVSAHPGPRHLHVPPPAPRGRSREAPEEETHRDGGRRRMTRATRTHTRTRRAFHYKNGFDHRLRTRATRRLRFLALDHLVLLLGQRRVVHQGGNTQCQSITGTPSASPRRRRPRRRRPPPPSRPPPTRTSASLSAFACESGTDSRTSVSP